MPDSGTRMERDWMGELPVPKSAHYGASTERPRRNFPISDLRLPRRFIRALAQIKGSAAIVNAELGLLDAAVAHAIIKAAEAMESGQTDAHFLVDVFLNSSCTSTH